MYKNQKGFGVIELVVLIAVVVLAGAVIIAFLKHSNAKSPNTKEDSHRVATALVNFEGQITQIVNHGGESCLTYYVNDSKRVAVMCPDMAGYEGFSGKYDKNIVVGDRVTVRGNLKTIRNSAHQTYHLDSPGTYLKKLN